MKRYFLISFLFSALFACHPDTGKKNSLVHKTKHPVKYAFVSEFEKYIETIKNDTSYPGAAIVIVKDSSVVFLKGLGVKKVGTTDSVTIHTVFRLASVSKGFASVLAGIFVQRGLLHWDDPVIKYLPGFRLNNPEYTKMLTVRNLLNQTTGLPTHTYTNLIEEGIAYSLLRDKLADVPLTAPPGTVHSYQNVAYSIIADILEKISGKSYSTLIKEEIFNPLKMNDASTSLRDLENSPDHAIPHINTRKGYIPLKNTDEYYMVLPAAGVNASIADMGEWLKALLGNSPDVLSPSMLKEVFAPSIVTPRRRKYFFMRWLPIRKTYYGMGWRVLNYNGDTVAYHGGYVKGFRAEIALSPAHKVGIVILSNAPGKFINNAIPTFFNLYYEYKEAEENKKSGF
jgi:beta-lactamase class C